MEPWPADRMKRSRLAQVGVGRVEGKVVAPQGEGAVGGTHGEAGVTGIGLLDGIGGKDPDGVGALPGLVCGDNGGLHVRGTPYGGIL